MSQPTGHAVPTGHRSTFPWSPRRRIAAPDLAHSLLFWPGAVLVAVSALIHPHLWSTGYRHIPTIGPLFLLQGIAGLPTAAAVAVTRHPLVAAAILVLVTAAVTTRRLATPSRPTLSAARR